MTTRFTTPQGDFTLRRYPLQKHDPLRAWDAADEYVLNYIADNTLVKQGDRILLLNEGFGALVLPLLEHRPVVSSDSYLAHLSIHENLKANRLAVDSVELHSVLDDLDEKFDLVVIKVPKNMGLLHYELIKLRQMIRPHSRVIVAGMMKYMPRSVWTLLEDILGKTMTLEARKKAKIICVEPDIDAGPVINPYPTCYRLEDTALQICNHANVFSRDSLDIGTRFFLQHIPQSNLFKDILDLGCGNGVVGLVAAEKNPDARIHYADESYMAIASARENYQRVYGTEREASYHVTDCLSGFDKESVDLILCNPPFHQQHAVGDQVAVRMFKQAHQVLKQNGELWVIGNRHLGYHISLKKIFGNSELVASNKKFVILRSVKS